MAETLRRGREVAVQLVKEDPQGDPPQDLSWEGMTPEEASAENERQKGAITARHLDCQVSTCLPCAAQGQKVGGHDWTKLHPAFSTGGPGRDFGVLEC